MLAGTELPTEFRWHCEPQRWSFLDGCLRVAPEASTDFWQRTHYGFQADNGHFLYHEVNGDFVLSVRVLSRPVHQYDQAGLMVRVSADCWLKTSVEFEPQGPSRLGAVVTNHGYSDWSTQDFTADTNEVRLRIRREVDDYLVGGVCRRPAVEPVADSSSARRERDERGVWSLRLQPQGGRLRL